MRVKKFIAPTMPEAMKKVRAELGQDAVILNSKVINKGGFFGLFVKKNIEVIAAIDPEVAQSQQYKKVDKLYEEPKRIQQVQQSDKNLINTDSRSPELLKEIQDLKEMMANLSEVNEATSNHLPSPIRNIHRLLDEQDVYSAIRDELVHELLEKWYLSKGEASFNDVYKWLLDNLHTRLSVLSFGPVQEEKKFINVIGPTGVGKTTTLAKMAAHEVLKRNKKCAFITTDTYRIAAVEQLKTYASILNIPIEVAYTLDDFKKAKEKLESYDKVFVDTAGRNFRNKEYIKDLTKVIDFDKEMETYLVMALTAKNADMEKIHEQFQTIHIDRLIYTKSDETASYGSMLNMCLKNRVGVAYITHGQNVPDDIEKASPKLILNKVFGVNGYEGSS
ncbi:flagellar biosynthesis protein FlhF [Bacillus solimangrovi]|uniref:Flagellar biosynthesis protein FlhF n=1 Tax=Bacillus solimangrovi TaxID=1305675 RepID=A0A1E5LB21_9BACI|nr:flagellar biosynthesis protein FlhF [Bacillus solimangrovi]OEH91278.1 flagellar biosynthesis protein FlhF [Bacillus solimangrovi]